MDFGWSQVAGPGSFVWKLLPAFLISWGGGFVVRMWETGKQMQGERWGGAAASVPLCPNKGGDEGAKKSWNFL